MNIDRYIEALEKCVKVTADSRKRKGDILDGTRVALLVGAVWWAAVVIAFLGG